MIAGCARLESRRSLKRAPPARRSPRGGRRRTLLLLDPFDLDVTLVAHLQTSGVEHFPTDAQGQAAAACRHRARRVGRAAEIAANAHLLEATKRCRDLRGNVYDGKAGGPFGSPITDRCSEAVRVCH
jgi:hypothetical protein